MGLAVALLGLLDFLALVVSFFSLCIVCDEHLVPAVEVFIVQFEVPEEVAAVTLVAFGSAAPELFLNSVSAVAQTSDLSMAAILGSGIIAFGLIPSACILSATKAQIKLHLYPILRESTFYLIGLFTFLISIRDGRIASYEAGILILVYFLYTGIVALMYFRNKAAQAVAHQDADSTEAVELASNSSDQMNSSFVGVDSLSPGPRTEKCRFFPTLSRSTSDLTRRSVGKHSLQLGTNTQQDVTIERVSSSAAISDSEYAGFLQDDIEAVDIDISNGSSHFSSGLGSTIGSTSVGVVGRMQSYYSSVHDGLLHEVFMRAVRSIYTPIEHVIRLLLPALHPNVPHFIAGNNITMSTNRNPTVGNDQVPSLRAVIVLASCIVAIGVLAVLIVLFCESVIAQMGFSSTAVGATLVALGAEIPDTVSAVALARSGYYNAAIAGAIGSQVINVTLGVGVPALLVCLFGDGFLRISQPQTDSLVLLTCLLIGVIFSYITVTVPIGKMLMLRRWSNHTIVNKPGAMFQVAMWAMTYVMFLHLNHGDKQAIGA